MNIHRPRAIIVIPAPSSSSPRRHRHPRAIIVIPAKAGIQVRSVIPAKAKDPELTYLFSGFPLSRE